MIILSYRDLPELAHLPPNDRRAAYINFIFSRSESEHRVSAKLMRNYLGVGSALGWVLGERFIPTTPGWAAVLGMAGGAVLSGVIAHIGQLQKCRPALRDYIESPQFTLTPVSERAARAIRRGQYEEERPRDDV
jgi:hypothetical protein